MERQSPRPAPAAPRRSSARLRAPPAPPQPSAPQVSAAATAAATAARRARELERLREVEEPEREVRRKVRQLASAVRAARHLVVYTGAGISTAARIPDYRGPSGLWTALRDGRPRPRVDVAAARPTLTHMVLAALWRRGRVRFVVSQNCDGLHLRAGLPRRALAELHGNMFVEHCVTCRARYLRAFDTTERTARSRHRTGRLCLRCGAELRDSIVHFGERGRARWPLNWAGALHHAARADVVLCLGSSLKVLRRYPRLWGAPRRRPRLYIVNLQWTPKDAAAELKISARCDVVMRELARLLHVRVPRYRARRDPLFAHRTPLAPLESHTTHRKSLRVADLTDSSSSSTSPSPSPSRTSSSSSSADSDDDRPLCVVADRLRAAEPPDDETALRSFSVPLRCGEATILMRARHAPAARPVSGLRLYRKPQLQPQPHINGAPLATSLIHEKEEKLTFLDGTKIERTNGKLEVSDKMEFSPKQHIPYDEKINKFEKMEYSVNKCELSDETMKCSNDDIKFSDKIDSSNNGVDITNKNILKINGDADSADDKSVLRRDRDKLPDRSIGEEGGAGRAGQAGDVMRECVSLARAIIAHAVVVCRAQLYPGLHNIIPPASPPAPNSAAPASSAPPAQCAWCLAHYSSPRCQLYPPRDPCSPSRPARTVDGRRYLCACCPPRSSRPVPPPDRDGWYGAGCRKPRRRR